MKCPKCGYQQPSGETCIDCGVIFSRYFEYQERRKKTPYPAKENEPEPASSQISFNDAIPSSDSSSFMRSLFSLHTSPWMPISTPAAASLSILFAVLFYLLNRYSVMANNNESIILYLLHQANLVFHEAGHVIFGVFGRVIGILGGSLGQLMVPLMVLIHFWYQRETAGFAFGAFWFFENFLDIAFYMGDARALLLPLIGGLGPEAHDWRNLFMEWGVLKHDTQIAAWVNTMGWIGMSCTWIWLARRWISDRK